MGQAGHIAPGRFFFSQRKLGWGLARHLRARPPLFLHSERRTVVRSFARDVGEQPLDRPTRRFASLYG